MACASRWKVVVTLLLFGAVTKSTVYGNIILECHCTRGCDVKYQCTSGGHCIQGWSGPTCQTENIALGKHTEQSSTINDCQWANTEKRLQVCGNKTSSLAVDGRTSSDYWSGTCTHTARGRRPAWWKVDLGKEHVISNMKIYYSHPDRMVRLRVTVENSVCFDLNYAASASPLEVICSTPLKGRRLKVQIPGDILNLCEVEIYECSDGTFGHMCSQSCNCRNVSEICNKRTGKCHSGCAVGYSGTGCNVECSDGTFGHMCSQSCNCRNVSEICNKRTGKCHSGCAVGYSGTGCNVECSDGTFGHMCSQSCNCRNVSEICDKRIGKCHSGCAVGYSGTGCHVENIALGKHTEQSSTINDCQWADTEKRRQVCGNKTSSLAVDGRTSSDYWSGTCTHTVPGRRPVWWKVDLGKEHVIRTIMIYFPNQDRMRSFSVKIDDVLCYELLPESPLPTSPEYITCNQPLYGRNVTITNNHKENILNLCEVEIYECKDGSFGQWCDQSCNCKDDDEICNKENGHCDSGCSAGYRGTGCQEECADGMFAANCKSHCYCRDDTEVCDKVTGYCSSGCRDGYTGLGCQMSCPPGRYGFRCSGTCGGCDGKDSCDPVDGNCTQGCLKHWTGIKCKDCKDGWFGSTCDTQCKCKAISEVCNKTTGQCASGCEDGWRGFDCYTPCDDGTYGYNCSLTCGQCLKGVACGKIEGECSGGCEVGFQPPTCQECEDGWFGMNCTQRCRCKNLEEACNKTNGQCVVSGCGDGWTGHDCYTQCPNGTFGFNCSQQCGHCDTDVCNKTSGYCPTGCQRGWTGPTCKEECPHGTYGFNCSQQCGHCDSEICNKANGHCPAGCESGWRGPTCKEECPNGTYGYNCSMWCGHCDSEICNKANGHCSAGCESGWRGPTCKEECPNGTYGYNCNMRCGHCDSEICNKANGHCPAGCESGWRGPTCKEGCPNGTYGFNCSQQCGHCDSEICSKTTGYCSAGCESGWKGQTCKEECLSGTFGVNCSQQCGHCDSGVCSKPTGHCTAGCERGWRGLNCKEECPNGTYGFNCSQQCGHCDSDACNKATGHCSGGCEMGWKGPTCKEDSAIYVKCRLHLVTDIKTYTEKRCNSTRTYGYNCNQTCGFCLGNEACDAVTGHCLDGCHPLYEGVVCQLKRPAAWMLTVGMGVLYSLIVLLAVLLVVAIFFLKRGRKKASDEISIAMTPPFSSDNATSGQVPKDEAVPSTSAASSSAKTGDEDTYMNVESTRVKVSELYQYITRRTDKFELEYKRLPKGLQHPHTTAAIPANKSKNRFKAMYPYDHSRVVLLKTPGVKYSEYINASYIDSYTKKKAYIATQGPNSETVGDFWRMVWQEECPVIVMLTKLAEGGRIKCEKYWPDEDTPMTRGDMRITNDGTVQKADFVIRELTVHHTELDKRHQVTHLHYVTWPDHDIPSAPALVRFWKVFRSMTVLSNKPFIVHCSAGVGRTGTFIALDVLMDRARKTGIVDVYDCVNRMREDRVSMVQTKEQYLFLHQVILEALYSDTTNMTPDTFESRYKTDALDSPSEQSSLEEEWKNLQELRRVLHDTEVTASLLPENIRKTRVKEILPADKYRPIVTLPVVGTNDYINAVFLPTESKEKGLVVTQVPLPWTVVDFWRLVIDYNVGTVVTLTPDAGSSKEADEGIFWPQTGTQITSGPFVVSKSGTKSRRTTAVSLQVWQKDSAESTKHEVQLLYMSDWPESKDTPCRAADLLHLVNDVLVVEKGTSGPVVVMCSDGATRSGLFCAVFNVIQRLKIDSDIDIYLTARCLQTIRPGFLPSLVQYKYCYQMVKEFQKTVNPVYENFKPGT